MYAKKQAKKNTVEPVSGEGENAPKPVDGEIDPLTGILNLTGFYNRINDWIAKNPDKKFRIHRYDLDHFKDINGVYGHELGDALLKDIARYMKRFDDETSFSAHLYADHFMRFCAEDALPVQDYYDNFSETFAIYPHNDAHGRLRSVRKRRRSVHDDVQSVAGFTDDKGRYE